MIEPDMKTALNRRAILQLVKDGECSCRAVALVLGDEEMEEYRSFARARVETTGFYDVHSEEWDLLSREQRAMLREGRLVGWFLHLDGAPPALASENPVHEPSRSIAARFKAWVRSWFRSFH